MIKRILEISSYPAHLSVRHRQLLVQRRDNDNHTESSYPLEDLGFVCVDQPQVTYSHQALMGLLDSGTTLIICDRRHIPAGMLLPFSVHAEIVNHMNVQLKVSLPRRKQLWQQIIQAKIIAQSKVIKNEKVQKHLRNMAKRVLSDDMGNMEAQAARLYWSAWLDKVYEFKRNPDGEDGINGLLNYGYAVIRAAIARALVNAGLQPAIGIHHHHRANPFCLADDLMEPLRPLVDTRVRELIRNGIDKVCPDSKAALLDLLSVTVGLKDDNGPLMVALPNVTASLLRCFQHQDEKLLIPFGTGEEGKLPQIPDNRH